MKKTKTQDVTFWEMLYFSSLDFFLSQYFPLSVNETSKNRVIIDYSDVTLTIS